MLIAKTFAQSKKIERVDPMKSVINRNIDLGNGRRVNVYIGDETTPSPYSVEVYEADYSRAPDAELADAFTQALKQFVKEEIVTAGQEDLTFSQQGKLYIDVEVLANQNAVRVAVSKDYEVKVEESVTKISCPGQPGWYAAPRYYRTTALALALVAMVSLAESRKTRSI
jgi:hypothetical protein